MKIAIIGTRGIPNEYGGFEQFADVLSQGLAKKGIDVTVYCSANHSYKEKEYNGVKLIHKYDPENKIGTAGQFIYDLACMLDARKRNFDIIYMLGYTSSSIWQKLIYKKGAIVVTNMDGLEWMRSKYSKKVQRFLKFAEKLAIKYSDYLVADSIGIQKYLKKKYNVESSYYPYGSYVFENPNEESIKNYDLVAYQYDVLIARFEPENNIEMVLEAFYKSKTSRQLILIGNYKNTEFGIKMAEKFATDKRIRFLGGIYDQNMLDNIRFFSNLYFHGHSVGGTNPSLLEAMGSSALICYHKNDFNEAILGSDGYGFSSSLELSEVIDNELKKENHTILDNNLLKIKTIYSWEIIVNQYIEYLRKILNDKH